MKSVDNHRLQLFTRSYDLISEYRRMKYSNRHFLLNLPRRLAIMIEYQFLPHYFSVPPRWRLKLRKMFGKRTLQDFAVIGPIKGGSSDLTCHLLAHPCMMVPLAKEIFTKIKDSNNIEKWRPYYPTVRQKKRVAKIHKKALSGFFAPYLHMYRLINGLYSGNQNMKIVIILRDPVKRAYSHWKWEVFLAGKDLVAKLPYLQKFSNYVELALKLFPEFPMDTICGLPFLQTGIYPKAVKLWIDRFGVDNVIVLNISDYFFSRNLVLGQIQEFLEITRLELPQLQTKINENPMQLPAPDEKSNRMLAEFYEPYNRELFKLIEKEFEW